MKHKRKGGQTIRHRRITRIWRTRRITTKRKNIRRTRRRGKNKNHITKTKKPNSSHGKMLTLRDTRRGQTRGRRIELKSEMQITRRKRKRTTASRTSIPKMLLWLRFKAQ